MNLISNLKDNHVLGEFEFFQSSIVFIGKNNLLIAPFSNDSLKIKLEKTEIKFHGDNSIVFLNNNQLNYRLNLLINNNSYCHIGANNFFNSVLNIQCSESCNVFIGDECLFSFGIWFRTSDVHLIYDIGSRKRINQSKSIFIGDRVWIGQDAKLWKGTQIGSGAILGADSFTTGKRIPSNTAWGGNPAKMIRKDVYFTGGISSHGFTDADTKRYEDNHENGYIFKYGNETIDFGDLDRDIKSLPTISKKAEFLVDLNTRKKKNRFFI